MNRRSFFRLLGLGAAAASMPKAVAAIAEAAPEFAAPVTNLSLLYPVGTILMFAEPEIPSRTHELPPSYLGGPHQHSSAGYASMGVPKVWNGKFWQRLDTW